MPSQLKVSGVPAMARPYEKFGRVLLLKTDGGKGKKPEYTEVEGAYFSNFDLKWYTIDGKIHPLFKDYIGKSYSVSYTFEEEDKYHKKIEIDLVADMPVALGEMCHQDIDYLEIEAEEAIQEALRAYGAKTPEQVEKVMTVMRGVRGESFPIFAGITRRKDGAREGPKPHLLLTSTIGVFDDGLENEGLRKEIPYKVARKIVLHFQNILRGKESQFTGEDESLTKAVLKAERFCHYCRDAILRNNTEEDAKPFFDSFMYKYLDAVAIEISREWRTLIKHGIDNPTIQFSVETLSDFVRDVHACEPTIELWALCKGIKLDEDIRRNLFVQKAIMLACDHISVINDILSFRKEFHKGFLSNVVGFYHSKEGMTLKDAMQVALDKLNENVVRLLETDKVLREMYPDNEGLHKYLDNLKHIVVADVQWYAICQRYHPELIYDCVVKI